MHAVFVEDDERLAHLTTRYLESHGVVVDWFCDGKTGLNETLRVRPNIVLLDLQLPALDGINVCRWLRERSDAARGNSEEAFDRSIDVQISRLRQKLGDDPRSPRLLKTVRGHGYMLVLECEP